MRKFLLLLCLIPAAASAQRVAPPSPVVPAATGARDTAAIKDQASSAGSVAWIYEERSRLVHACVLAPEGGGRIQCWSKSLSQSEPSR